MSDFIDDTIDEVSDFFDDTAEAFKEWQFEDLNQLVLPFYDAESGKVTLSSGLKRLSLSGAIGHALKKMEILSNWATGIMAGNDQEDFSPSGIGSSFGDGSGGVSSTTKAFIVNNDPGFRFTTTSPQAPIPIIIGTRRVGGTIVDWFFLGENDRRLLAVVGIGVAPLAEIKSLVDSVDITTLPNFIDVGAGEEPLNDKPWIKFFGDGGQSGDIVVSNGGKKLFDIVGVAGDTVISPRVYIPGVVSGKNEARVFIAVDVPGVVADFLETDNADYTSLTGKTLIIDYVITGDAAITTNTVTFTGALISSSADYTALNGKTLIVNIDSADRTVTFTGAAVDAATTSAEIASQLFTWAESTSLGAEVRIYAKNKTSSATIYTNGGTAEAQLNFGAFNDAYEASRNITVQVHPRINGSVVNVDEVKIESNNPDNKYLSLSGTGFAQLNIPQKNNGTTIDYTLKIQEVGNAVTTTIVSASDIEMDSVENGVPIAGRTKLIEDNGNFFIEASFPNSGWWQMILEIGKATNGANVSIFIVEVMRDFLQTTNADYSLLQNKTLIADFGDGISSTVTFGSTTTTQAQALSDIGSQWANNATVAAEGDEMLFEALIDTTGTDILPEVKQMKIIGGTAISALDIQSIYSETKNYNFPGLGYAIINLIKDNRIAGHPSFSFDVTGAPNNPAQNLLDLYTRGGDHFGNGLNLPREINRTSFENSIAFCDAEGYECNLVIAGAGSGQIVRALLDSGSLIMTRPGGIYTLIPETDSSISAELHVTDDVKKDGILRNSWQWNTIDKTMKYNVLRISFSDEDDDFTQKDIVIDVSGEVDTINNAKPRIYEDGALINISDSTRDFIRIKALSMPAVTSRVQALRLGNIWFQKQHRGRIGLEVAVSIRHAFLNEGYIVSFFIDELGFTGKKFRIMNKEELGTFGHRLTCAEHFDEVYRQ